MTYLAHARIDFRAMGTDCSIQVWGSNAQTFAALGRERVDILEGCWSRFRATSELSLLNSRAGNGPTAVSADMAHLVQEMRSGWHATGGAFDPTIAHSLVAHGYDADFQSLHVRKAWEWVVPEQAPGMGGVSVGGGFVELPAGIALDPGAIGKGLAADIVVDELMGAGVDGVLVDLGGDIAHAGMTHDGEWVMAIRDERSAHLIALADSTLTTHQGLATSTTLTRRWAASRHHVLDPRTGTMTNEQLVQVTVQADRASIAEIWATAFLVRPELLAKAQDMPILALSHRDVVRNDFAPINERVVA